MIVLELPVGWAWFHPPLPHVGDADGFGAIRERDQTRCFGPDVDNVLAQIAWIEGGAEAEPPYPHNIFVGREPAASASLWWRGASGGLLNWSIPDPSEPYTILDVGPFRLLTQVLTPGERWIWKVVQRGLHLPIQTGHASSEQIAQSAAIDAFKSVLSNWIETLP